MDHTGLTVYNHFQLLSLIWIINSEFEHKFILSLNHEHYL